MVGLEKTDKMSSFHMMASSSLTSAWRNKAVCLRVFLYTNVTEAEERVWRRTWYVLSVCSAPTAPPTPMTSLSTSRGPGVASEPSGRSLTLPNRFFGGYKQSRYVRRMFACREVARVCVWARARVCIMELCCIAADPAKNLKMKTMFAFSDCCKCCVACSK